MKNRVRGVVVRKAGGTTNPDWRQAGDTWVQSTDGQSVETCMYALLTP